MANVDWKYRLWQAWTALWGMGLPLFAAPALVVLTGWWWSLIVTVPAGIYSIVLTVRLLRS